MSGHSKWANIKHRKEKSDAQKAQIFTKVTREIIVAARQGGGDPENNFRLRLAVQKARAANMPGDNIARAIKRGTGGGDGANYEEIAYEGYGPGGTAILVDVLTDNRNRSAGDIRHLFSKYGGNLGENGCVAWMFEQKGVLIVDPEQTDLDEEKLLLLATESGAEDLRREGDVFSIITDPAVFEQAKAFLEDKGIPLAAAEITMLAKNTVELEGTVADQLQKLLDALEEHDDIQQVYTNHNLREG